MSKTYKVQGMTCGGCSNSVINAIKGVAPNSQVSVDLEADSITVEGAVEDAVIAKAVDDAGFDFGGVV